MTLLIVFLSGIGILFCAISGFLMPWSVVVFFVAFATALFIYITDPNRPRDDSPKSRYSSDRNDSGGDFGGDFGGGDW
ncbi:hypothetical protein GCE9029_02928 [Grimontia celer]|uniref:Uncharacterized protein n=1 Tax=Grimontia celer TaxID=1796497 RepID=A0A128F595_9GAMM|nr:hypothetical protein GCE9029_02928 [Grimontia celer]